MNFNMSFGDKPKGPAQSLVEWIATGFSIAYFLTPLYQVLSVYRKKMKAEHIPILLLVSIMINCCLWMGFAIRSTDWLSMLIGNSIGLGVNYILLILHLYLFFEKKWKPFLGYSLFVTNLLVEIGYLMFLVVQKTDYIGFTAMLVNVFMYGSPILNIYKLYSTGEYGFLPILTNLIGFMTCIVWMFYGVMTENDNTIISNGVSLLLLVIQIGFWFYFFFRKIKTLTESTTQTSQFQSRIENDIKNISINEEKGN